MLRHPSVCGSAGILARMGTLDRRAMQTALPAYDIDREIGRGACGIVLAAHHRQI